jgi:site-specific DNA-cytosine methylase
MKINVLSLFDGISCGRIALDRVNIPCNYWASEIDEKAVDVTKRNWPETVHLGDVMNLYDDVVNLPKIDLLIGGSPCQSFSNAGKGEGFQGKSGLFWEFVRIKEAVEPSYFMLENVMMKREWRDQISEALGVEPVMIDSKLVSAQNRKRLYWTNIPLKETIDDRGLTLNDIVEQNFDQKYWLPQKNSDILHRKVDITGAPSLCAIDVYNKKYKTDGRCPTLTHPCHNTIRLLQDGRFRKLTPLEYERLQNVPEGYTAGHSDTARGGFMANGWTVDVISYIFGQMKNDMKKVADRKLSINMDARS